METQKKRKKEAGDAALDDQQVEVTGLGGIFTEKIGSYGADFERKRNKDNDLFFRRLISK